MALCEWRVYLPQINYPSEVVVRIERQILENVLVRKKIHLLFGKCVCMFFFFSLHAQNALNTNALRKFFDVLLICFSLNFLFFTYRLSLSSLFFLSLCSICRIENNGKTAATNLVWCDGVGCWHFWCAICNVCRILSSIERGKIENDSCSKIVWLQTVFEVQCFFPCAATGSFFVCVCVKLFFYCCCCFFSELTH